MLAERRPLLNAALIPDQSPLPPGRSCRMAPADRRFAQGGGSACGPGIQIAVSSRALRGHPHNCHPGRVKREPGSMYPCLTAGVHVGVDGPPTASMCQSEVVRDLKQREPSVEQIIRIGMDTSKTVFQLHGVNAAEQPVLRKKLRRHQVLAFFAKLAPTRIGMEACGSRVCSAPLRAALRPG